MHKNQKKVFIYGSLLFIFSLFIITNLIIFIRISYFDIKEEDFKIYLYLNIIFFLIYLVLLTLNTLLILNTNNLFNKKQKLICVILNFIPLLSLYEIIQNSLVYKNQKKLDSEKEAH